MFCVNTGSFQLFFSFKTSLFIFHASFCYHILSSITATDFLAYIKPILLLWDSMRVDSRSNFLYKPEETETIRTWKIHKNLKFKKRTQNQTCLWFKKKVYLFPSLLTFLLLTALVPHVSFLVAGNGRKLSTTACPLIFQVVSVLFENKSWGWWWFIYEKSAYYLQINLSFITLKWPKTGWIIKLQMAHL